MSNSHATSTLATLNLSEIEELLSHLNHCLGVMERKNGILAGPEIRIKTLLSVVRDEVVRRSLEIVTSEVEKT